MEPPRKPINGSSQTKKPADRRLSYDCVRMSGGRYRIRTYDFHRVKMALYR